MICKDCNQEMTLGKTCTVTHLNINNEIFKRIPFVFNSGEKCHDCGILNNSGHIHHYGCDMERCPKCSGQLISCNCTKYLDKNIIFLVVGDKFGRYVDEIKNFYISYTGLNSLDCLQQILKDQHSITKDTIVEEEMEETISINSEKSIIEYLESNNGDGCDFLMILDITDNKNIVKIL